MFDQNVEDRLIWY